MDVSRFFLQSFSSLGLQWINNCSRDGFESKCIISPPSAAVNNLLVSNEAPIHSQALRQSLDEAESAVSSLDQRLAVLEAEVQRLHTLRDTISTSIQTYKIVLHPIRRTPPEVLLEIFSYCIDFIDTERHASFSLNSLNTKNAPWSLGHVCRYWRSLVLGCPRLWSSLALDLGKLQHDDPVELQRRESNAVLLLSHFLKRSRECSLSVAVSSPRERHPLLSQICSHSARWKDVLLALSPEGYQALSCSIKGHLPTLQYLHIRDPFTSPLLREDIWNSNPPADAFLDTPNLISVHTHGIPSINTTLLLPYSRLTSIENTLPSWSPITTASGLGPSSSMNMDILIRGRNLKHAVLFCAGLIPQLFIPIPQYTHSSITSFSLDSVKGSNPELMNQLLDALTFPSLSSLRVCVRICPSLHSPPYSPPDVRLLVRLIERSACSLSKLHLKGMDMTYEQGSGLCALLETNRDLQILCLDEMSNGLVDALTVEECPELSGDSSSDLDREDVREGSEILIPQLFHLRISGPCPADLDQARFIDMLQSRKRRTNFATLEMNGQKFVLDDPDAKRRFDEMSGVGTGKTNSYVSHFL